MIRRASVWAVVGLLVFLLVATLLLDAAAGAALVRHAAATTYPTKIA
jgi:hypothetical protein